MILKPSFFQQAAASAEQLQCIVELEPLLRELAAFHLKQSTTLTPVWTRMQHAEVAEKLSSYLETPK